ncbi:hypothetical protein EXIGLDRAFT_832036 [Exidia glandulosa HHB12029]|uniref:Cell wall protein n=1 Tax=Exidia glandulosa HHB12029 TaxID=1314781 RepID=A0A165M136_EXIGL|nr:hypothetical protein EXIGLDRAFT_832036 [Exidia glandulosa HHB12029]
MQFITLAVVISAAAVSAAPVPPSQATLLAPITALANATAGNVTVDGLTDSLPLDKLPVVGSVLNPVLGLVDSTLGSVKGALPADFVAQLKTALNPLKGLPVVGDIVDDLLGEASANTTGEVAAKLIPTLTLVVDGVTTVVSAAEAAVTSVAAAELSSVITAAAAEATTIADAAAHLTTIRSGKLPKATSKVAAVAGAKLTTIAGGAAALEAAPTHLTTVLSTVTSVTAVPTETAKDAASSAGGYISISMFTPSTDAASTTSV